MRHKQHTMFTRLLPALLLLILLPGSFATAASRGISLEPVTKTPALPFVSGRYRALVVGNDDYRDPQKRWPTF
ncbi:MAG: hypothetical protein GXP18_08095 [Gammaproteobacteria bacterium]|nr:hypothetical protein [Gammaproteobacteria bacterium]